MIFFIMIVFLCQVHFVVKSLEKGLSPKDVLDFLKANMIAMLLK